MKYNVRYTQTRNFFGSGLIGRWHNKAFPITKTEILDGSTIDYLKSHDKTLVIHRVEPVY